ncbi:hypothetical protein CLAIMM_14330 [Cladophialophora immunda]|nr:hypothetical protein CLAIMM_14330 [Cladophialophora immunda]
MASTEKAKEEQEAILPSIDYKYLNLIKLHEPQLKDMWYKDRSPAYWQCIIPPPSHRVMIYRATREHKRILKRITREHERILQRLNKAYSGYITPGDWPGCFQELLQWLHRFDFTQDNEGVFDAFLTDFMAGKARYPDSELLILQTQTHEFFLDMDHGILPMNTARAIKAGKRHIKNEEFMGLIHEFNPKNEKLMKLTHEFTPALQVERDDSDHTEELILPLRFGFPLGRLIVSRKERRGRADNSEVPFHLVFHPIDKSFWMVVDRYRGWERFGEDDDWGGEPEFEYDSNEERTRRLGWEFGKGNDMATAEAFRLGTKDLWFPQGLGLMEELDGGAGLDGNKSEEPVSLFHEDHPPPTIEFSNLPRVPLFPDTEAPQVHYATRSSFQSYLAENGVVKGRSWLSVAPSAFA